MKYRLVALAIMCGLAAPAQACSPDQYRIVEFTPAIGHWQDEQGQDTGQQQPTFSGRIASNCRGVGTVEIEIIGRDAAGRQVQQAVTAVRNVGPGGGGVRLYVTAAVRCAGGGV